MKTIKRTVFFKATPHELYEAFMDAKKHSRFTDTNAKISRRIGGKFSVWHGYIKGSNIKLVPDKKIVQKWTSADFPEGHYTDVTLEFKKSGNGTKLVFTQKNVPDENYDDTAKGWDYYYWKPLKEMIEKN